MRRVARVAVAVILAGSFVAVPAAAHMHPVDVTTSAKPRTTPL